MVSMWTGLWISHTVTSLSLSKISVEAFSFILWILVQKISSYVLLGIVTVNLFTLIMLQQNALMFPSCTAVLRTQEWTWKEKGSIVIYVSSVVKELLPCVRLKANFQVAVLGSLPGCCFSMCRISKWYQVPHEAHRVPALAVRMYWFGMVWF